MSLFDPTAADVKALDDVQLRELLARVGAAELRARGQPETGVGAGGDQRARDGGIDVRLTGDPTAAGGIILRLPLGIQVKATRMRAAAVKSEMRPHGRLREAIVALAAEGGAYVIASGRDDLSDEALRDIQAELRAALGGEADLPVDFWDASRLARWAGQYPGVSAWLITAAGRPSAGWAPLRAWSTPGSPPSPYLIDAEARIVVGAEGGEPVEILRGLEILRGTLARPGAAGRLVGVSGMGKTRLAEAVFDPLVGEGGLSAALVVYGDAGAAPAVSPAAMAEQLVAAGRRAILIVDNCPAALHRVLTGIVATAGSEVSLLTIDFDVGPDEPDRTRVFRLHNASGDLIDALLQQRAPHLTGPDRQRISEFCDGNTRLALVLARAIETGGAVTGLKDADLLDRLLLDERRGIDQDLRAAARVAALVYAFEAEGPPEGSEADWLAQLAGIPPMTFHRKIGELLDRGMAQQRGIQRAILPPAIAAWLAEEYLAQMPPSVMISHMVSKAPLRLRGSFLRRLSLIHPTEPAREIARLLLQAGGPLADPADFFDKDLSLAAGIAHLAGDEALSLARRMIDRKTPPAAVTAYGGDALVKMLRDVAYEARWFDGAVDQLARLACAEPERSSKPVTERIQQFFQLQHSGTMASPAQKLAALRVWLAASDARLGELALRCLDAGLSLNARRFDFLGGFPRRRDTGAGFGSLEAVLDWIRACLSLLADLMQGVHSDAASKVFLARFPALAADPETQPIALGAFESFRSKERRTEEWFAFCRALSKTRDGIRTVELLALEERLRPGTLEERFDTWLFCDAQAWRDPAGDPERGWEHCRQEAERVGTDTAGHPQLWAGFVLRALTDPKANGYAFGAGLARGEPDKGAGWLRILTLIGSSPASIQPGLLAGYANEARKTVPEEVERWIDDALSKPRLAQAGLAMIAHGATVDDRALGRILTLLRSPAKTEDLAAIWLSRVDDAASDQLLADVVDGLVARGQTRQTVGLLDTRIRRQDGTWGEPLVAACLRLLTAYTDAEIDEDVRDYFVGRIGRRCFTGEDGRPVARAILDWIVGQTLKTDSWLKGMPETLLVIAERYPDLVLDILLVVPDDDEEGVQYRIDHLLRQIDDDDHQAHNALDTVSVGSVLSWITADPEARAHRAMNIIPYFRPGEEGNFAWTPIVLAILDRWASERVLDVLYSRLASGSSSGPTVGRHLRRRGMVASLIDHSNSMVKAWAEELLPLIDARILEAQDHERRRDQRFE